jgi:hypothetical protein
MPFNLINTITFNTTPMHKTPIIAIILAMMFSCQTTDKKEVNTISIDMIDNENPPVMEFENDDFDFGTIAQGQKVSYTFKFTNTGKSDLAIMSVVPTCGCTVPSDWPKHPIKPGKGGEIKVEYDGSGNGVVKKLITVNANTKPSYNKLHIKGKVIGPQ